MKQPETFVPRDLIADQMRYGDPVRGKLLTWVTPERKPWTPLSPEEIRDDVRFGLEKVWGFPRDEADEFMRLFVLNSTAMRNDIPIVPVDLI